MQGEGKGGSRWRDRDRECERVIERRKWEGIGRARWGHVRWSHGKCIFSINIQSDIHGDKHAGAYVARNPGTRYLTPTA